MRLFLTTLILILTFILECKSESDTLLINLKSGTVEKIALSDIKNIKFENITGVNELTEHASKLTIIGNYPNPFAELTFIDFEIEKPGKVKIFIYNSSGNQIQKLECENCKSGKNTLQWNCIDKNNNRVQSGTYLYEVRFNNEVQSRKMILIK